MQMRQQDVFDLQTVRGGEGEVLIDVPLWIHHCRDTRRFIADEIRGVREAIQVKLVQDHALESGHYGQVYTR